MKENPYLEQIYRNLPRVLALYDTDTTSPTYGLGDRFFWSWKLIDFANGTYQALVSGMALLLKHDLLPPHFDKKKWMKRIKSLIIGLQKITAKNGSLSEAFPNEGSFCVTGLVGADVLLALHLLKDDLSADEYQEWLEIVTPLIEFLHKQDEYHGMISNHLATSALAMVRYGQLKPEARKKSDERAKRWISRILQQQSREGWFKEYDGADPGYQSWCLASLISIDELRPEWKLREPILNSFEFIQYAAHPDGCFGGSYGSRMTRFVFPSGFERYKNESPIAKRLALFFETSIKMHRLVTLDAIDNGNLIPLFNDYVHSAIAYSSIDSSAEQKHLLPYENSDGEYYFQEASWYIYATKESYTVLNIQKGGAGLRTFHDMSPCIDISPPFAQKKNGTYLSGGFYDEKTSFQTTPCGIKITCGLKKLKKPLPTPFNFLILRCLALTLFRSRYFGNLAKILLAKYLVNKKPTTQYIMQRTIKLEGTLEINDHFPENLTQIAVSNFHPIHMASLGYWQFGDEQ